MKMLEFFNVKRLWDITWAHGVNDKKRLRKFSNDNTMMIEGDISFSENGDIIMAHPPQRKSDLTFDEWIETISEFHKGAKLDFKDPKAVIPVLKKMQKLSTYMPVFLNADILKGPGGSDLIFDPSEFISICNEYYSKADYLSLGWTVEYIKNGEFTNEMVDNMITLSKKSAIPVTISVLIYYMPRSWNTLKRIFKNSKDTITIWGVKEVGVSEELGEWVKIHVDPDRTFVDLIDKNGSPIRI